MFELTGAVSYILPIMITVVIAKWVAEKIERQGIYDALITFNKFPFLPTECNIKQGYIEDIMTLSGDLVVLHVDCIVADIQYAANQFLKGFPVLTKNEELVGYVLNSNLQNYLEKNDCFADRSVTFQPNKESYDSLDLSHLVDTRPVTVHPQMPLDVSVELFRKMGLRVCIVTYNGIIKGIVTKKDLLSLFI